MKTIEELKREIYKANGKTFYSYAEVEDYAKENDYRITNTTSMIYKKTRVVLIDLKPKP